MTAVFADTFYYLTLVNKDDVAHDKARTFSSSSTTDVVTTEWVLTELGDALSSPRHRPILPTVVV
jgi:predicted nucleic acid-binding protein